MIEKRLLELGIQLPEDTPPKAMYIPIKQVGNLLFASGQIPTRDGKLIRTGKVGAEVSLEEAQDCAQLCVINLLSALKAYLGDLDRIKNVVKVQAFVSSAVGFDCQHLVINAASQLLFDVFGEAGRHTRTAMGTNQLPMDAPVEIEAILEV